MQNLVVLYRWLAVLASHGPDVLVEVQHIIDLIKRMQAEVDPTSPPLMTAENLAEKCPLSASAFEQSKGVEGGRFLDLLSWVAEHKDIILAALEFFRNWGK